MESPVVQFLSTKSPELKAVRKNLKKLSRSSCFLIFCRVIFASALTGRIEERQEKEELEWDKKGF